MIACIKTSTGAVSTGQRAQGLVFVDMANREKFGSWFAMASQYAQKEKS